MIIELMEFSFIMKTANGNALFLILIAVALFAALSYAVTQSGRGGGSIEREQADLMASQVLEYGAMVRASIQRMHILGIPYHEMSSETDQRADQNGNILLSENSLCTNTNCRIFHPEGGGVAYRIFPVNNEWEEDGNLMFAPGHSVILAASFVGLGSDLPEIIMVTQVDDATCRAINRRVDFPQGMPTPSRNQMVMGDALFADFIATVPDVAVGDEPDEEAFIGRQVFCVEGVYNRRNVWFVLVDR